MKLRFIPPFLVIALFVISACTDESMQPNAVDPKDTMIVKDSAEVKINFTYRLYGASQIIWNDTNYGEITRSLNFTKKFEKRKDTLIYTYYSQTENVGGTYRNPPNSYKKIVMVIDSSKNIITYFSKKDDGHSGENKTQPSYTQWREAIEFQNIPFTRENSILIASLDSVQTIKKIMSAQYYNKRYSSGTPIISDYQIITGNSGLNIEIKLP